MPIGDLLEGNSIGDYEILGGQFVFVGFGELRC